MRILFITSNRLGDAILSTGLLRHLIERYPEARFTVVCGAVAQDVFVRMPRRERTIVLEKRPHGRHWLPLWAATVGTWWHLVVDIRGSAMAWLVPTHHRAVLGRRRPGPKIEELAAILGLDPAPLPVTWRAPADEARADAVLPRGPIIALAPTANWRPKIWPAERFVALFKVLHRDDPSARAVVFGGPGPEERAMAAPLLAALPDATDLVGRLSVPEVAACLARTALFVGNDSGLMHLAAAAGAPTIGLFGPTNAIEYGPSGREAIAVTGASMAAIEVDAVVAAARRLRAMRAVCKTAGCGEIADGPTADRLNAPATRPAGAAVLPDAATAPRSPHGA